MSIRTPEEQDAWNAAERIAEVCRVHGGFTGNGNRSFNRDTFMTACGFAGQS